MRSAPTFRQCLLYALPALVLAAVLRLSYILAIPEAEVDADTNSYVMTGHALLTSGHLVMHEKRRWLYPLLLVAVPMLPGTIAQTVAVLQHAAGLLLVGGTAWIVGQLTRFWRAWIPLVTLLIAAWPELLYYEHVFLAEALFADACLVTVALSLPVSRLRKPRDLGWFLLALTFACGLRPGGRALWLGAAVLLLLVARERWAWRWWNLAAALLATVVTLTAGSSRDGSRLLLSSMLPLVDLDGASEREYRQALAPVILEARRHGLDYPWFQEQYKTRLEALDDPEIGWAWRDLIPDLPHYKHVAMRLALETVARHPIIFARFTWTKFRAALAQPDGAAAHRHALARFDPALFWQAQLWQNLEPWQKHPDRMSWIFGGLDRPAWETLAQRRGQRTLWCAPGLAWMQEALAWERAAPTASGISTLRLTWLGALAALGLAVCARPRLRLAALMIWLPLLVYVPLIFGAGDRIPRFVHPLQWILLVLCALALDALAILCADLLRRRIRSPRARPSGAL